VIALYKKLQEGWIPPKDVTRKYWIGLKANIKNYSDYLVGYVGICCSYNGIFLGSYSGKTQTKEGIRDYQEEAFRNLLKQALKLKDVDFINISYDKLEIPENSIIYCDPPYCDTTKYSGTEEFNHKDFWQWCRDKVKEGHSVFISEYTAPDDFKCIWSKEIICDLASSNKNKRIEKLFIYEEMDYTNIETYEQQKLF